ncbi:envelope stress response membrane protein PspC [Novosphingobium sp.]|uniref:envelope stress response membrane protein PspC n=1 Tax=Novosphingobium sp. TaxID=1874826 RepID=UPI003D14F065
MNTVRTKFYRDKINGKWLGVCSGIADYTGLDVLWVRLGFVVATLCGLGFVPVIYILLGIFANAKPYGLYTDAREEKFWQGVRQSPTRTSREVRAQFREIDRRLAEVEAFYVSSNPRLANEIEQLR